MARINGSGPLGAVSMKSYGRQNKTENSNQEKFKFLTEQFGEAKILRYQVPGFDSLSLKQKKLIYFLSQAALCGRDITYDQHCKYNLLIRKTCETIYEGFKGDRSSADFNHFTLYLKELWFNNGLHHHYSTDKTQPEFSKDFFISAVKATGAETLPLEKGQTIEQFTNVVAKIIFDTSVAPKRLSLDPSKDLVLASACNFYDCLLYTSDAADE